MDWTSAPSIEVAPPEPARRPLFAPWIPALFERVELFLEAQRPQLPAWWVVAFGAGILAWFGIDGAEAKMAFGLIALGVAVTGVAVGRRAGRLMLLGGLALALGLGHAAWRSARVAAPVLARPQVATFDAKVERVEIRAAQDATRLTVAPIGTTLPPRVRVNVPLEMGAKVGKGGVVRLRARLQPPPPMLFPGTHDFARDAWFKGIGAVGKSLGPVTVLDRGDTPPLERARRSLESGIARHLDGAEAGIAIALATGTQAAVTDEDAEAMRRSGLTHLLSVSGLHIAAVVGAAMLLSLRLLALSERLALRFNLVLVSAGVGALAGIGYTLLTGMQVPTVRSCIAALLVLLGIALGREALSLRLVAVGALVVLLVQPEALMGVSFQLSFAAVAAIVALHGSAFGREHLTRREEGLGARWLRGLMTLLVTGLVVEAALMPLTLYHFHRSGLYAVAANLFAIPWTTFVIMPAEFVALLLEPFGLSAPFWDVAGWAIGRLLDLAHAVAGTEGAVATLPSMPAGALLIMVAGGLWLVLWNGRIRIAGLLGIAAGAAWAAMTPVPDLLVSGDGRHVAVRSPEGRPLLLRERTGDFTADMVAEASAFDGDPGLLADLGTARCSRDACVADVVRAGRAWRILAVRTRDRIAWRELVAACGDADIVVADRWLPRACTPRWLKLDRKGLEESGGVAITFEDPPRIDTVSARLGTSPWRPLAPPRRVP